MKNLISAFKLATIFSSSISIGILILFVLVWGVGESNQDFMKFLYVLRYSALRLIIGGLIGVSLISIVIYINSHHLGYSLPCSALCSMRIILASLSQEENQDFNQDMIQMNKLASILLFVVIGVFSTEYFIENLIWQDALLQSALFILPIAIASVVMFLLSVPIGIIIFSVGDFIKNKYR